MNNLNTDNMIDDMHKNSFDESMSFAWYKGIPIDDSIDGYIHWDTAWLEMGKNWEDAWNLAHGYEKVDGDNVGDNYVMVIAIDIWYTLYIPYDTGIELCTRIINMGTITHDILIDMGFICGYGG